MQQKRSFVVWKCQRFKKNDKFLFPNAIITPTTKNSDNGSHDEDISREAIFGKTGFNGRLLVLEKYTRALYQRGTEIAAFMV